MCRRVKNLREDCDLTQEYLAKYLSCSQSSYSKIETGKRHLPVDYLIKLSELYHVSTDYILGLTDYPCRLKNK
ncbi:helix-turn-helix domain-containing protein [Streptococcus catagoni]|uniref:helix-turn-helix domain-containing protein n=1 Tax=Streptococcus catagoni TaxID=2654874 RepID=UPI00140DF2CC|nr:helix-turn-helix transcriptional regulator [Streptococcus catagoni]